MAKKNKRGQGSVYKRGRRYWIQYHVHGEPFREPTGSTDKRDADALLKKRLAEVATGVHAGITSIRVGKLLDGFLEDYAEQNRSDLYIAKKRIEAHLRPMLGDIRAIEFGSHDLKRYIQLRRSGNCCSDCRKRGKGAENATINRELSIVRRAFKLAASADPPLVTRVPNVAKLPEDNVREGFVEHDQFAAVKEQMWRSRLVLVIGYYLGLRRGEIMQLKWGQVDLKNGVINLSRRQTKNRTARTAPLYGELDQMIRFAKEERDALYPVCEWVCSDEGNKILDFRKEWKAATAAAGVPELLFHDLRRSAVRNMVRAGIPERVAMAISGHKTRSVFDRYNIVSTRDVKDAGEKMAEHFRHSLGTKSSFEGTSKERAN